MTLMDGEHPDLVHSRDGTPATMPPKRVTNLDPNLLPDEYAMVVEGDCLAPEIAHGTCLMFDKRQPFAAGDFVVLWRRPKLVSAGRHQAIIKRLVMGPPRTLRLPYREHPDTGARHVVIAEQLNPWLRFAIPCADLLAIHYCLGPVPADAERVRVSDEEMVAMHRTTAVTVKQEACSA